jgi:hypothetical protein
LSVGKKGDEIGLVWWDVMEASRVAVGFECVLLV